MEGMSTNGLLLREHENLTKIFFEGMSFNQTTHPVPSIYPSWSKFFTCLLKKVVLYRRLKALKQGFSTFYCLRTPESIFFVLRTP